MLLITVPAEEYWDENKEEYVYSKEWTLQLEHSLLSISKWESKYCKPFLTKDEKTAEETLDYIKFMTISQNVPSSVYDRLTRQNIEAINEYIGSTQTATTVPEKKSKGGKKEIVTSELIYYWMIALNIPLDKCEKWHLNRLLTLIRVCDFKNDPPKKGKASASSLASQYAALNKARRQKYNTTG